jgi:hypothetical protein
LNSPPRNSNQKLCVLCELCERYFESFARADGQNHKKQASRMERYTQRRRNRRGQTGYPGFTEKQHATSTPFSLTYRVVMCKQHSAIIPNQVSSFNPLRKEDLIWSMVTPKPRYSEQMEIWVLCFVTPGNMHDKRCCISSGNKSTKSTI